MADACRRLRELKGQRASLYHSAKRGESQGGVGVLDGCAARARRTAARRGEYDVRRDTLSQRLVRDRPRANRTTAQVEVPPGELAAGDWQSVLRCGESRCRVRRWKDFLQPAGRTYHRHRRDDGQSGMANEDG